GSFGLLSVRGRTSPVGVPDQRWTRRVPSSTGRTALAPQATILQPAPMVPLASPHHLGATEPDELGTTLGVPPTWALKGAGSARMRGILKQLLWWTRRAALTLVALLLSLAGAGATYEAVASSQDAQRYLAPGRLVDVRGYQLHIQCLGLGSP